MREAREQNERLLEAGDNSGSGDAKAQALSSQLRSMTQEVNELRQTLQAVRYKTDRERETLLEHVDKLQRSLELVRASARAERERLVSHTFQSLAVQRSHYMHALHGGETSALLINGAEADPAVSPPKRQVAGMHGALLLGSPRHHEAAPSPFKAAPSPVRTRVGLLNQSTSLPAIPKRPPVPVERLATGTISSHKRGTELRHQVDELSTWPDP